MTVIGNGTIYVRPRGTTRAVGTGRMGRPGTDGADSTTPGPEGPSGPIGPDGATVNWIIDGWTNGTAYATGDGLTVLPDVLGHNDAFYFCIASHTSSFDNEPGVGVNWEAVWRTIGTEVTSVNGQANDVVLDFADVGADPAGAAAAAQAAAATDATTKANAKVVNAIVDGVTTIAPAQDVVFDWMSLKENVANRGVANGYASLDGSGFVPSAQLPSFVDDVLEFANAGALPGTGTSGKLYVTLDDLKVFRWSGSVYVEVSASLALGEISTTAYRGDRGKIAYDHSQISTGNPHGVTKTDLGIPLVTNDRQLPFSGWLPEAVMPTYTSGSNTNIRVYALPTDATTRMSVGWFVRLTDTTVRYGIIVALTATSVTLYMGTDYIYSSTSNPTTFDISPLKAPLGFPTDPAKWTVSVTNSSNCVKASPTTSTWYGDTGLSSTGPHLDIPIGAWKLSWTAHATATGPTAATSTANVYLTLSTSASTESDTTLTARVAVVEAAASNTVTVGVTISRRRTLTLAAPATYYLNAKTETASTQSVGFNGTVGGAVIEAVCAYL